MNKNNRFRSQYTEKLMDGYLVGKRNGGIARRAIPPYIRGFSLKKSLKSICLIGI
jgi:hypothetical protein